MTDSAPAPPLPRSTRLAVGFATAELLLACVAYALSQLGICPAQSGSLSCAALIRSAFAQIGPLPIALLGVLGAGLTVVCALAAQRTTLMTESPRLAIGITALPAAGAGFVLGLQALPLLAGGGVCPVCLGVALAALATAVSLAVSVGRVVPRARLAFSIAFTTVLLATVSLAALQGLKIGNRDKQARTRLLSLSEPTRAGKTLLIVHRTGCPFCEAQGLDVLGRSPVVDMLEAEWRIVFVTEDDPRALEHAGGRGAPVLIAFDASGTKRRGRLRGYRSPEETAAWLDGLPE